MIVPMAGQDFSDFEKDSYKSGDFGAVFLLERACVILKILDRILGQNVCDSADAGFCFVSAGHHFIDFWIGFCRA